MRLGRVLRGVVGTAAAWGLAWVPLTAVLWTAAGIVGGGFPPSHFWGPLLLGAALRGAITGGAFAAVVAIAGRRRAFAALRTRDMVLWGAVGGLVAPLITIAATVQTMAATPPGVEMGLGLGLSSVLGAVSGAGTLAMARRAPALPSGGDLLLEADPGLDAV